MAEHTMMMEETLLALLSEKKYFSLRDILNTMNPSDIASIFDHLEEDRLPLLFRLLPKELAADTFVEMEPEAPVSERVMWGKSHSAGFSGRPIPICASRSTKSCAIRRTAQVPS